MSLALAIYLIAPWGSGLCNAGVSNTTYATQLSIRSADVAEFPVSAGMDEDVFYDFMEAISQFINKVLASDQAGNTSAISIWNH